MLSPFARRGRQRRRREEGDDASKRENKMKRKNIFWKY